MPWSTLAVLPANVAVSVVPVPVVSVFAVATNEPIVGTATTVTAAVALLVGFAVAVATTWKRVRRGPRDRTGRRRRTSRDSTDRLIYNCGALGEHGAER